MFMFYCPGSLFGYCPIIRIDFCVILWKNYIFSLLLSYHIFATYVGGASLGLPTACRLIAVSGACLPLVDGLVVRCIKMHHHVKSAITICLQFISNMFTIYTCIPTHRGSAPGSARSSVFRAWGRMSRGLFSRVRRCGLLCLRAVEYDHCHVLYIFRFPHWCTQIIVTCSPLSRPQLETQFPLILILSFFEHQRHEKQICRGCPGYLRGSHWLSMGPPGVSGLASTGMQKAPATVNG